ncbi:MAG: HipA domain-containing protein, partial [Planctomycetota bacterium]
CPEDLDEFLRRVAFMIVCGNGDAHLKNWGLVYPDRRHARLGPAYDLVSTVVYPDLDRELALDLGGRRSFADLDGSVFGDLARMLSRSEREIIDVVEDCRERALQVERRDLGYNDDELERLDRHVRSTPWLHGGKSRRGNGG